MDYILSLNNITKKYDDTIALDNINLTIEPGKIYGLIGRNGAGKTTMLKLIANMLSPTNGKIIYNKNIIRTSYDICFGRDYNHYFTTQKVKAILDIASRVFPDWDYNLEKELIELFELPIKKTYMKISKGMQTITSIIIAMCSNSQLILLDEPYAGLDPINRDSFYKLLREKYLNGEKTVILSSHLIKEIEGYFQKAIIINKGNILVNEDMENIYEKSFAVICDEHIRKELIATKNVIDEDVISSQYTLYIYDTFTKNEQVKYISKGAQIKGMDLQKLLISLCSQTEVKK